MREDDQGARVMAYGFRFLVGFMRKSMHFFVFIAAVFCGFLWYSEGLSWLSALITLAAVFLGIFYYALVRFWAAVLTPNDGTRS
jgi:hypothetical protein